MGRWVVRSRWIAAVACVALSGEARADDDDFDPFSSSLADDPVYQARQEAEALIQGGLRHLQDRFDQEGLGPCDGSKDAVVARMAFAALAFMAAGHTTDHSPFATPLRRSIRWLTEHVKEMPPAAGQSGGMGYYFFDPGDSVSKMHGHGYATWALALAYGMTFGQENSRDRQVLERTLIGAVRCIERSQTDTGGWGYDPQPGGMHEGSMTVTQLQALRAARDAGVHVRPDVIDRAVEYLRKSQMTEGPKSGSFRYMLGDTTTSYALTAAAVSSLNQTGIYHGTAIEAGIEYMRQSDPVLTGKLEKFPWYSRLYAAQAYWQYERTVHFRRYYPELVETLRRESVDRGDGKVSFNDAEYGTDYATALAVIALCVPRGYLPSFQR